jgi:tetratricopeptide (TPR) repeat protein
LAGNFAASKDYDSAIAQYQAVLNLSPGYTAVQRAEYEAEGDRFASRGQPEEAVSQYRKALDLTLDRAERARLTKKLKRAQK